MNSGTELSLSLESSVFISLIMTEFQTFGCLFDVVAALAWDSLAN